jgi:hypothetical protein
LADERKEFWAVIGERSMKSQIAGPFTKVAEEKTTTDKKGKKHRHTVVSKQPVAAHTKGHKTKGYNRKVTVK